MTQFALVATKKNFDSLVPIIKLEDEFLISIAGELFPSLPIEEVFTVNINGHDIDSLMLDAQRMVIAYSKFEETDLYRTIAQIVPAVDELILWYGSSYEDLDYVYDTLDLLSKLEESIRDSACELYIHYKRSKKEK